MPGASIFTLFGAEIYTFMLAFWGVLLVAALVSFKAEVRASVKLLTVNLTSKVVR